MNTHSWLLYGNYYTKKGIILSCVYNSVYQEFLSADYNYVFSNTCTLRLTEFRYSNTAKFH